MISVPWLYGTETYFLEDILNAPSAAVDNIPCLRNVGGLGR